jgi:hypothetical protein
VILPLTPVDLTEVSRHHQQRRRDERTAAAHHR